MSSRRIALVALMVGACTALSVAAVLTGRARQLAPEDSLPVLYEVPAFRFTDSDGKPFSRDSLKGKVWVADFIFTTCTGPCPILSGKMAALHRAFKDRERVNFVSISVDPEQDTPAILKNYAAALKADTTRWHFLTAPKADVNRLAVEGFKVGSADVPLMHDLHFILVDTEGRIRGYYTGTDDADLKQLSLDIELLLEEVT